ncbi:MAG TPA: TatD family hydrolase [Chthonomonadales bacterium]|nr:TatD family hydrolase [Chthonomonadales bacterium]
MRRSQTPAHLDLFDSHCHLNDPRFDDDRADVLARAASAGVTAIMVPGYDLPSSERAAAMAAGNPMCVASAGIHPHDARHYTPAVRQALESLVSRSGVVAIGEIGLDYHYEFSPPGDQREAFRDQIELAVELGLPVVLHCREAYEELLDTLETVQREGWRGVLHCFSGHETHARRGLAMGFHLGIGGAITFRKADALREIARIAPLERLLVETDAPYLAPEPHRGKRNEPAYAGVVARRIAEVRGEPEEQVAAITAGAARALFGVGASPADVR